MAQSTIVVYGLTGSNRRFIVPFEYLARRFVTVTLLGDTRTKLVLNSDYRFIGLNEIETTAAHGGADGYDTIEIRRETSATERLVEFFDGSVLRSRDMNVSAIQTIHIAEEARNLAGDTLTTDDDGNLDARNRRMVNLAPAVNGKDAINYDQVLTWSGSARNQANVATAQAGIATTQAGIATTQANASIIAGYDSESARDRSESARDAAEIAETRAAAARDAAEIAEGVTLGYGYAARDAASDSAASASAALASKNAAAGSEVLAQKWAENPEDAAVTAGKFSAKHWAQKAATVVLGDSFMAKANNLSDVDNVESARDNLGLKGAAVLDLLNIGTTAASARTALSIGTNAQARATFGFTTAVNHTVEDTLGEGGIALLNRGATTREIITNRNAILGYGSIWKATSNIAGTTYTNTLSRPIVVVLIVLHNDDSQVVIESQGSLVGVSKYVAGTRSSTVGIIAAGQSYTCLVGSNTLQAWYELR